MLFPSVSSFSVNSMLHWLCWQPLKGILVFQANSYWMCTIPLALITHATEILVLWILCASHKREGILLPFWPVSACWRDCMQVSTLLNISQMLIYTIHWTNLCNGMARHSFVNGSTVCYSTHVKGLICNWVMDYLCLCWWLVHLLHLSLRLSCLDVLLPTNYAMGFLLAALTLHRY